MDSRRTFFKQIVGEIARGVQEIARPSAPEPARPPATVTPLRPAPPAPREPAPTSTRGATLAELLALADEVGLAARRDDVARLARASVRLAAADATQETTLGGSRLGGAPDLPPETAWPHWRERPLTFLLQLDLAEVAPLLADGGGDAVGLPREGVLACFAAESPPDGFADEHAGACAVVAAAPPPPGSEPAYGRPALLTRELMLPRCWAAPVTALALDADEAEAWTTLRRRLAELQGIVPADEDRVHEAPHRLLGYPDERSGAMPLACASLAAGLDATRPPLKTAPGGAELDAEALRWRLVLQLSLDDRIGWRWGDRRQRLYVWAHEDDLAAGELSRLRPFIR